MDDVPLVGLTAMDMSVQLSKATIILFFIFLIFLSFNAICALHFGIIARRSL